MIIRQRTGEWYKARIGKFTASKFATLMARPSDRSLPWSKTALKYIQELALQIHLNEYIESPDNNATRWGMRNEGKALDEFSMATGFKLEESGFMLHPGFPEAGATPDAFVIEKRESAKPVLAQVKCPYNQKYHHYYSEKIKDASTLKKFRSGYHWQIQGEIWVTNATHSYFVSFDPRLTGKPRLHYALIERDNEAIEHLENVIKKASVERDKFLIRYGTS